jgi:VIT1/CCC1 family predicted Fe2+/Mn2+ transporter
MEDMMNETKRIVLEFQRNEITEHFIYKYLSERVKGKNKKILDKIGQDELRHYNEWKEYTHEEVEPDKFKIKKFVFLSKLFGITFAIKLMENGEKIAEKSYKTVIEEFPKAERILKDEEMHEMLLVNMIQEEKIGYISSMVLGLNDALVEITGTLAGLTFALRNATTIGVAGLITGSAASLSMAASEYLSEKAENGNKNPSKAALYTFFAYLAVVFALVLPYFIVQNYFYAFLFSISMGIVVILIFSVFVSVVQDRPFGKSFIEMFLITVSVGVISFVIGILARKIFHIEV